jgi:DnaJ-class molecular chaperone
MNPYDILGVDKNSTPDEIKSAYRKLASKHHPDRGGDTKKFQEIQSAYDVLADPQKRAAHDNPHTHFDPFMGGGNATFQDFINQFVNQNRQRVYTVTVFVTLEQIVTGSVNNVSINTPHGQKLVQLQIPTNIEDGNQIRYDGILPDGPLQVLFRVYQHPTFNRHGNDLYVTQELNVFALITGTTIIVADIYGKNLEVVVPPMTKPGSKLRIPGRGLGNTGDQYVLIEAKLPDKISNETLTQIKMDLERTN